MHALVLCTIISSEIFGNGQSRLTKMPLEQVDDAVVVDARGHDDRDGRELLIGARVRACGRGHVHAWRVGGQSPKTVAVFNRRRGRSQQHHDVV